MNLRWAALFFATSAGACSGEVSPLPTDAGTDLDGGVEIIRLDAGEDPGPVDAGPPEVSCTETEFSLEYNDTQSVWVTGSFTNWAGSVDEGALALSRNSDGIWTLKTNLPAGRHTYKFVVSGDNWIQDPNNPNSEDDGFGGQNSVIEVCAGESPTASFEVLSHSTLGARFEAQVAFSGPGDIATLMATLDHGPVAPGAVTAEGQTLNIDLDGLSDGIHDLRLQIGAQDTLLKIYVNESTDWRDTTMYFVMTDRFKNGNPGNDAPVGDGISHPLAEYLGGDFAGVIQQIEAGYFDDLGVNSLWITWPLDNPDRAYEGPYQTFDGCNATGTNTTRFSGYHGYWPKSGSEIESRFGTAQELETLVDTAHARGIRILFDFTANHVHEDSRDYAEHPEWFNLPAQLCRDGLWDSDQREECWFDSFLPDWNFTRAGARTKVLDDAIKLAKVYGADGFRVDALKHMEDAFIRELRTRVKQELESTDILFYLVGETFTGDTGLIDRYVGPDMLHGQFDFPTNMAIRKGLATDEAGLGTMHQWVRDTKQAYGADAPLMSTFAGNHDIARFVSKASGQLPCGIWSVGADVSRAHNGAPSQPTDDWVYAKLKLAMAYVYTVPGIPLLYYGDEVGLAGAGDPDNRRMLPEDVALNPQMRGTRDFMKALGQLRASAPVLRTGDWTGALMAEDSLLVFARTSPGQQAVIVMNRGGGRDLQIDVGALGVADGTTMRDGLSNQSAQVSQGRLSISVGTLEAQIFVTQ